MKTVAVLAASFLLVSVSAARGQVTARQGDATKVDPKQFSSPMILEVSLNGMRTLQDGMMMRFADVVGYWCEDVTIENLEVSRRRGSKDADGQYGSRLDIDGRIFVRESYDRFVTLRFSILTQAEGAAIAGGSAEHLKAEERKRRPFHARIDLTAQQLAQLAAAGSAPVLRLTVSVQSDK